MKYFLALFLFGISFYTTAHAQFNKTSDNTGWLTFSIMAEKGGTLPGAHITITFDKNVINLVTNINGYSSYSKPLPDSVHVTVSYIGFETLEGTIRTQASFNVVLKEKPIEMSEVIVKGDVIAVITKGDTTQFNAAAFKTIEGNSMAKLFEKLPGMEIVNGELKYRGEKIDRITIDKQRLFGENVMLAINNIRADDVENVRVYKEDSDWANENGIKNAEQKTVADVTTKSKPTMIRNVTLVVAAGAETDTKDRNPLYEASGKLAYSCVGTTLTTNTVVNNTKMNDFMLPIQYKAQETGVSFNYYRNKPQKYTIITDNKFNHKRDASETWENRAYFPSNDYFSRDYNARNFTNNRKTDILTRNTLWKTLKDKSRLSVEFNFSRTDGVKRTDDIVSASQNEVILQKQNIAQREKSNTYNLDAGLGYSKTFKSKISIDTKVSTKISENDEDGWRVDTLQSSTSRIYIYNTGSGSGRNYTGTASATFPFSKHLSFNAEYETGYIDTKSECASVDMLSGMVDTNNTFDYKIHELNNAISGNLTYRNNDRKKGISTATVSARWINKNMQRDEYFPKGYEFPRTFNLLRANAKLEYKLTELNKLTIQYNRSESFSFNLLDLRDVLDDRNPIMLKAGNPGLNIPVNNSMRFEGKFGKNTHNYGIVIEYNLYENAIVEKVRYFTSDTYIPEFNYTAMSGSSLATKENVKGSNSLWTEVNYSKYTSKLQSTVDARLSYQHEHNPAYIGETPAVVSANRYKASLRINGNFSSVFEPSLSSYSKYSNVYNGRVRNKEFTQSLNLNINSLIAKKWEINSENKFEWNLQWPEVAGIDRFRLVSTLSFGYRCSEGLTVKATVNDIFNNRTHFYSDTHSDYTSAKYMRYMGRYVLASAEWKF